MSVAVRAIPSHSGSSAGQSCAAVWRAGGGEGADGCERLPEFVVKLAREMAAFVVLQRNQLAGQRAAEALGEMIEDVANRRQLRGIERRKPRREVTGGDPFETGADHLRRTQGARQRRIDQRTQERQRDRQRRHQAAGRMPGFRRQHGRIDPDDGLADPRAPEGHGTLGLAAGIEEIAIERGEGARRLVLRSGRAAAEALHDVSIPSAKRKAQAGRDHRGRDRVEIGKIGAGIVHPLDLALLQHQRSRGDVGDRIDPRMQRPVGLDEEIAGDRREAQRRDGGDAQRQAQLQIGPLGFPHWRTPR